MSTEGHMKLLLRNIWWRVSDWLHKPADTFMEASWLTRFKKGND